MKSTRARLAQPRHRAEDLPETFASDPERLARFTRQAQILGSINHPHIAQLYGVEDWSDVRALAMELVEGPTLADVIPASGMPLAEASHIARQITEALLAAHDGSTSSVGWSTEGNRVACGREEHTCPIR